MGFVFGRGSRAALANCHPTLQAVAAQALELSTQDFTVTNGAGLCLAVTPHPDQLTAPKFQAIAEALRQAAREMGVVIRWSGDFHFFGDLTRFEIDEPANGQQSVSSPTAAPNPVMTFHPATSITHGGPAYERLVAWLKAEEGFRATAYPCSEGKQTIGYGYNLEAHGVPAAKAKSLTWTREQADKALRAEITAAMAELEANWPRWDDEFDQVRQAVFLSGVYQLGVGGAGTFKNTIACLRAHDFDGAVRNLNLSKWARQTPNRVGRIAQMLLTGQWPTKVNGVVL